MLYPFELRALSPLLYDLDHLFVSPRFRGIVKWKT
jgi:hypothetical protein